MTENLMAYIKAKILIESEDEQIEISLWSVQILFEQVELALKIMKSVGLSGHTVLENATL